MDFVDDILRITLVRLRYHSKNLVSFSSGSHHILTQWDTQSVIKTVAEMAEIKLCSKNTSEIWSQYHTCSGQGCGPISYCTLPPGGIWSDWHWHQSQLLSTALISNPWNGRRGSPSALAGCHIWRFTKPYFPFQAVKSEIFNVVIGWVHGASPSWDISLIPISNLRYQSQTKHSSYASWRSTREWMNDFNPVRRSDVTVICRCCTTSTWWCAWAEAGRPSRATCSNTTPAACFSSHGWRERRPPSAAAGPPPSKSSARTATWWWLHTTGARSELGDWEGPLRPDTSVLTQPH